MGCGYASEISSNNFRMSRKFPFFPHFSGSELVFYDKFYDTDVDLFEFMYVSLSAYVHIWHKLWINAIPSISNTEYFCVIAYM